MIDKRPTFCRTAFCHTVQSLATPFTWSLSVASPSTPPPAFLIAHGPFVSTSFPVSSEKCPYHSITDDNKLTLTTRVHGILGTVHGIAWTSLRSWCSDVGVERDVAEACFSHCPKGVADCDVRTDFYDRRAVVMQRWDDDLGGTRPARVVELRHA